MDKTKTGIASLLYSKKSEIRSLEVDKEIEHAATVLGSGRVIKEQGEQVKEAKQKPKLPVFKLNKDTYAMAFKALHWETQESMGLQQTEISNAFHAATIVFVVQMIMLSAFSTVIFGAGNPRPIAMG